MKHRLFCITLFAYICTAVADTRSPEKFETFLQRAHEHKNRDEIDVALAWYKRALELDANNFSLVFEIANLLFIHGYPQEAIDYYERASKLNPSAEQVYFNKGVAHDQLNEHEQAAECFMQAINTNAKYERAYLHAIKAFRSCNKIEQGLAVAKRSINLINNNAELHYRYALLLKDKEEYTCALSQFHKAVILEPTNRHYLLELGNTLYLVDNYEEALYVYERLLEMYPTDAHILYNFGITLKALGFVERALHVYDRIIELHPTYAPAQFSRAVAYLTRGDYEKGFAAYASRWQLGTIQKKYTHIAEWTGQEDLYGKTLLIYGEQGLGDIIQFVRYAELAKQMGAYVIVEAQRPLRDILKFCPFIDHVLKPTLELPAIDYQIAIMSMPHACKTTLDTIPHNVPYLHADPTLVTYWKEKLSSDRALKIGICWQGNTTYSTPELRHAVAMKSIDVALFAPLAAMPGVSLYSLQYGSAAADIYNIEPPLTIREFDEEIDTEHGRFMDTLAIMKNLDLIISVDTSICHIAGALNVPVWTLLPHHADWRWLQDRTDSPWYPSMRLFRQSDDTTWQPVIQACCDALQDVIQGKKTIAQVTQEKGPQPSKKPTLKLRSSSYLTTKVDGYPHIEQSINQTCTDTNYIVQRFKHKEWRFEPLQSPTNSSIDLHSLAHELIVINKKLVQLEHELKNLPTLSVADTTTLQLFKASIQAYERKQEIKKIIDSITTS